MMNSMLDKHICFVSANSYPLFTDDKVKSIGGVETRSVLLAKMMVKYFKKVSFAIRYTEGKIINDNGLFVYRYEPVIISNSPNIDIVKIDADIYVVFESHPYTSDVVRTCNITNKQVVHFCTHDIEYSQGCNLNNHDYYYSNWTGRQSAYSYYFANYRICQTSDQQSKLRELHGLDAMVVRNPIDVPAEMPKKDLHAPPAVLWIGRTDPVFKRPEMLIKIAKMMPDVNFIMIMNNIRDDIFCSINDSCPDNVRIHEYIPHDEMYQIYNSCDIFLSTSSMEGFPNVFLQSICHGLPIISLEVDPDGLFSRNHCGICCGASFDETVNAIRLILENASIRNDISLRAFQYVKTNHASDVIESQLVEFFDSLQPSSRLGISWADISYNEKYIQIQTECSNLQAEYGNLQTEYSNLKAEYSSLQAEYGHLCLRNASLRENLLDILQIIRQNIRRCTLNFFLKN